ncbi:hypothetical protein [Methanosarcina barkeri]|uniref:Uncharacterized protein n=1 Tax=Methanosarcina barkeri 227 TaxID=1434106 RepID=A0A0E3QZ84_METBA|nr:hypothetical protein [Methanosarcina barkeri]AKB57284.1 hypothetical protein MSBR2_0768 [Methanosarcina barkeri 227]
MDETTYDLSLEEILKYLREKASIGDRQFINEIYQKFFKSDDLSPEKFCTSVLKLKNGGNNFIRSLSCIFNSEQIEQMNSHYDLSLSQSLSMLLLFNSIENLMSEEEDESYYHFDKWIVSSKNKILGKSERDEMLTKTSIIDIELFNKLIKELHEIYKNASVSYNGNFEEWLTSSEGGILSEEKKKLLENTSITDIKKFNKLINDLSSLHKKMYGNAERVRSFFIKYLNHNQKKALITSIVFKDKVIGEFTYICFKPKDNYSPGDISIELHDHNKCPYYIKCKHCNNCKLENDNIDEVVKSFTSFLYGYYRSAFAHFGDINPFLNEEMPFIIDHYRKQGIIINLKYSELKTFITSGIKNYYFQNCEV